MYYIRIYKWSHGRNDDGTLPVVQVTKPSRPTICMYWWDSCNCQSYKPTGPFVRPSHGQLWYWVCRINRSILPRERISHCPCAISGYWINWKHKYCFHKYVQNFTGYPYKYPLRIYAVCELCRNSARIYTSPLTRLSVGRYIVDKKNYTYSLPGFHRFWWFRDIW